MYKYCWRAETIEHCRVAILRTLGSISEINTWKVLDFLTLYQNPPEDLPPGGSLTRTGVPEES